MKTILTKKIDDIDVVVGIDKPVVDAMSTHNKVKELIQKEVVYQEYEKANELVKNYLEEMQHKKVEILKSQGDPKKVDVIKKLNQDLINISNKVKELSADINEKYPVVNQLAENLFMDNLIYFETKPGEDIVTDEKAAEMQTMIQELKKNQKLTKDGNVIIDNRGKRFFYKDGDKWKLDTIKKLTDKLPSTGVYKSDATEQIRKDYLHGIMLDTIAAMTPEQKETEKQKALDRALANSAQKKIEYDILEDPDALKKSQDYYKAEKAKIEKMYS